MPLEKNADYLIADHLKPQAAPANSFSWQWIEDSAKAGRLLDANAYLIHKPSAAPSQPPTERQGTRVGRTPFTDEDDKLLIAFVQKARKEDRHLRGLEVYKELEKKVRTWPAAPSPDKLLIMMPEPSPHFPFVER